MKLAWYWLALIILVAFLIGWHSKRAHAKMVSEKAENTENNNEAPTTE